jgi:hypothetical protein
VLVAVVVLDHAGRGVEVLARQAGGEQVGGLDGVVVDGDDRVADRLGLRLWHQLVARPLTGHAHRSTPWILGLLRTQRYAQPSD